MDVERLKELQEDVRELLRTWKLCMGYTDKLFIMCRISAKQNEAFAILEKARLEFDALRKKLQVSISNCD